MEWSKLDLRKASLVKKEVDTALLALNKVLSDGDMAKKILLANSIISRIEELDQFQLQNDSDERMVLFEKERLRLRKAIQMLNATQQNQTPVPPSNVNGFSHQHYQQSDNAMSMTALKTIQSPMFSRDASPIVHQKISTRGVFSASMMASSGRGEPEHKVVRSQPIYAWESGQPKNVKKVLNLEGIDYMPTNFPGFYLRQDADQDLVPDKWVDFQIVLTSDEMTALISRRRVSSRADIKQPKSEMVANCVHTSVPFVDSTRLLKDYFRTNKPDRWISKQDIRPAKK